MLTGEYGGKAGFRHVLDGLGIEVADGDEDLAFSAGPAVRVRHRQAADRRRAAADRRVPAAAGAALPRAAHPGQLILVRSLSVRRGDHVRGRTGVLATVGPVAVGVMLAFGWNLAASHPRHAAEDQSRVTRQVGQTAQQAAGAGAGPGGSCPGGRRGRAAGHAPGPFGMKVFISFDMEGVAGIVDWSQCIPPGQPYEEGRRLLLGEVNAAIDGALAAGATEIVCNDSHGAMNNLDPELLHGQATLRVRAAQAAVHDAGPGGRRGRRVHGGLPRVDLRRELDPVAHLQPVGGLARLAERGPGRRERHQRPGRAGAAGFRSG